MRHAVGIMPTACRVLFGYMLQIFCSPLGLGVAVV
jgi:hypothetical protein